MEESSKSIQSTENKTMLSMMPDDLEPISPEGDDLDDQMDAEAANSNDRADQVNSEESSELSGKDKSETEPTEKETVKVTESTDVEMGEPPDEAVYEKETHEENDKECEKDDQKDDEKDTENDDEKNEERDTEIDDDKNKERDSEKDDETDTGKEDEKNEEKDTEKEADEVSKDNNNFVHDDSMGENMDTSMALDHSNADNQEPEAAEEVNMESLGEMEKDKSMSEDPFDAVVNSSINTSNDGRRSRNDDGSENQSDKVNNIEDPDETVDSTADNVDNNENIENEISKGNLDENSHDQTSEEQAVDNIEEGQGVDEELSLLPDAEREITDADKEKALLAEQSGGTDADDVTEVVDDEDDAHDDIQENNIDKGKDLADCADDNETIDAGESNQMNENAEILAAAPKELEIKEIQGDLLEKTCTECDTIRFCKYTLLQNEELKFLCDIDCVGTFRNKSSQTYTLTVKKIAIIQVPDSQQKCIKCTEEKLCKYRYKTAEKSWDYICDDSCLNDFIGRNTEKYMVRKRRYLIEEINETKDTKSCIQCSEFKKCRFTFKHDDQELYVCHDDCLNLLMKEQTDRFRIKRRSVRVRDLPKRAGGGSATIAVQEPESEPEKPIAKTTAEAAAARADREASFIRRCAQCFSVVVSNDKSLIWETYDFCNEICLGQYQNIIGSACTTCHSAVTLTSLGKYCVRFGYEVRQFCRAACLDEFKKGLKVCSFCQKDISKNPDGFLASVGGQFKDFCSQMCMKKYDEMCNPKKKNPSGICSVCNNVEQIRVEIIVDSREHHFCSNPCFSAFKFVNNIIPDKCQMCTKYFERKSTDAHTIYQDTSTFMFCSKICMNIYIITNRKIVPCQWCKVKKYNFDMIQKYAGSSAIMLCSLNCLTLCEVSMNAISMKKQKCDQCSSLSTPQYHLTMSDASLRNFCTYQCVMSFQSQFSHAPLSFDGDVPPVNSPVPTGLPKRIKNISTANAIINPSNISTKLNAKGGKQGAHKTTPAKNTVGRPSKNASAQQKIPVISNVTSLAGATRGRGRPPASPAANISSLQPVVELEPLPPFLLKKTYSKRSNTRSTPSPPVPTRGTSPPLSSKVEYKTQILTIPPIPKTVGNVSTMCKPMMESKETSCRPILSTVGSQTDSHLEKKILIPIPVPIYIPQPMHMYTMPVPIPIPIPLPIPVPVFIPTTRNSAPGIMKEIKKIQDKMPTDPFEAELLMMAEMVAGDKKKSDSDSDSEDEAPDNDYANESITENNAFGEDMLQMALKMAGEYEEPAVDLESAMTANTITPSTQPHLPGEDVDEHNPIHHHHLMLMEHQRQMQSGRGRKRGSTMQQRNNRIPGTPPAKRSRRPEPAVLPPQPEPPREPVEKADANMCLKFTFGVNAWKQWVMTKNADLEKSSIKRKPFKSELLQLTADELNYSLCLFVKEVRKPNGSEYAPDTIYYLVLGIQQYLYENGRIDNIFTDPYYERFTDCLDDVAKKFSVLYNDSQYIVTRVEEEHLWECKQLGAHSPHVLLSTLMFFNTKHFNLTTVEEHMQLSFSHIMKHWKRNPNQVGAAKLPGSRNVLLRFYPPQSALDNNSRKKKVYEQQENEENPLRCPVKLYEFYLSKCPESVKTRNDVFYLQPERSCVPDSPVWYSTQALGKESLSKMLHRVKMVKEINIALLTS